MATVPAAIAATGASSYQVVRISNPRRVRSSSCSWVSLPASSFFGSRLDRKFVPKMVVLAIEGSFNAAAISATAMKVPSPEEREVKLVEKSPSLSGITDSEIAVFMNEVASLVKLVDSRDIVELQMKQNDCELLIRKKEALPQPPMAPSPPVMVHAPYPQPSHLPPAPAVPPPPPSSALVPAVSAQSAPAAKAAKSGIPPLKSPMAGTFYRCPGPGEPPFVKIGDKVQKGQVLCIIEAMKLMNEIEADKSGTLVEILAEDGKPVSFDTPLFVIQS